MQRLKGRRVYDGEVQATGGYVHRQIWTNPTVASTTAVKAAFNSTSATVTAGITNPDFPRLITVVGTGSGHNAAGTVTFTGTDIRDNVITDTLTLNSNTTVNSVKAFKTVTNIDCSAVTGGDANNQVAVGTGAKLGLDRLCVADECVGGSVDTVRETTFPVLTIDSSDISKNLVSFSTTLANTKVFRLTFITTEKTAQTATTA